MSPSVPRSEWVSGLLGLSSALCLTGGGKEMLVAQPFLLSPGSFFHSPFPTGAQIFWKQSWEAGSLLMSPSRAEKDPGEPEARAVFTSLRMISFRNEWAAPTAFSFQNVRLHFESICRSI